MADQIFNVNCGFFDAINGDRVYTADDMNKPYSHFISDGVFATPTGAVVSTTNNYINLASGSDITIPNTVDARLQGLSVYGKTTLYRISEIVDGEAVVIATNIVGSSYTNTGLTNDEEHTYLVQSYMDGEWSSDDPKFYVFATPHIPTTDGTKTSPAVTITPGNSQITLSWDAVPNATRYAVYRYANGNYNVLDSNVTDTNYTITGLTNGMKYTFLVQSNVNGWSSFTAADNVSAIPHAENNVDIPLVSTKGEDGKVIFIWPTRPIDDDELTITSTNNSETREIPVTTGLPLRGIVTQNNGTYTDENEIQWLADEINFEKGCVIKRLSATGDTHGQVPPFEELIPPVEIPLSSSELAAYRAFGTLNGDMTRITNSDDAFMDVEYVKRITAMQTIDDLSTASDLQVVSAGSGRNISVLPGRGLFAQKWFENTSSITITVPPNSSAYPRYDSVIIQVDERSSGRDGNIVYRTGTAGSNPLPPNIGTVTDVTEYRLANIHVAPSASWINNDAITDLRGTSQCPWATSQIYQGNLAAFSSKFITVDDDMTDIQSDISTLQTNVSDTRSDVATLQSDVSDIQSDISNIQSDISDIQSDIADSGWTDLDVSGSTIATPPSIRRIGSQVYIRGSVGSNSPIPVTPNSIITTLSQEYRPAMAHAYPAVISGTYGNDTYFGAAVITISPQGAISLHNYLWFDTSVSSQFTSSQLYVDTSYTIN